jgi:hypothetical protein
MGFVKGEQVKPGFFYFVGIERAPCIGYTSLGQIQRGRILHFEGMTTGLGSFLGPVKVSLKSARSATSSNSNRRWR